MLTVWTGALWYVRDVLFFSAMALDTGGIRELPATARTELQAFSLISVTVATGICDLFLLCHSDMSPWHWRCGFQRLQDEEEHGDIHTSIWHRSGGSGLPLNGYLQCVWLTDTVCNWAHSCDSTDNCAGLVLMGSKILFTPGYFFVSGLYPDKCITLKHCVIH